MNWTLEVVVVPVADVDRAKTFYADKVGFHVDHDTTISDEMRIVQLTPRGSGCSIVVAKGMVDMPPGSLRGLQMGTVGLSSRYPVGVSAGLQLKPDLRSPRDPRT